MYRNFKLKAGDAGLVQGDIVQALSDNTIAKLPLMQKGLTNSKTIETAYSGKTEVCRVGDTLFTIVKSRLYISKIESENIVEVKNISLSDAIAFHAKILPMTATKIAIIYIGDKTMSARMLDITDTDYVLSAAYSLITNVVNFRFDVANMTDNRIAITYAYEKNFFDTIVRFTVAEITDTNSIRIVTDPLDSPGTTTTDWTVYCTRLSDTEFLATYCYNKNTVDAEAISIPISIDGTKTLKMGESFTYLGYMESRLSRCFDPIEIADNKVIVYESRNWSHTFSLVLKEVKRNLENGKYEFKTITSIEGSSISPHTNHTVVTLRETAEYQDIIFFGNQIVRVYPKANKLEELAIIDASPLRVTTDWLNFRVVPSVNISENTVLMVDSSANYRLLKYSNSEGKVLGFVKGYLSNQNQYSIQVAGLIEGLSGLVAGSNVYVDASGTLNNADGELIGRALNTSSILLRPELLQTSILSRPFEASTGVTDGQMVEYDKVSGKVKPLSSTNALGLYSNGRVYYKGYVKMADTENGINYYYDSDGNITTVAEGNTYLGLGVSGGLIIKGVI